jgi:peptide/nickel transport system substrate-binding protein
VLTKIKTVAVACALLVATAIATPAFSQAPAGTLTVSMAQDPGSWDPIDTFLVAWAAVSTNIYDGLTYRGPDGKLVPGLAQKWETLDGGKRIRFYLRSGVLFHDGEPFNAAAVKFTFDRLLGDEGAKSPQLSNYNVIESVAVIDDLTVDLKLKSPDPVLLVKLAGYGGVIVPPKYVKEKGDDYFNTHPVGTGPFKFVSYEPKVGIKLEAFDKCWSGAPKLAKLEFRFISEPSTAVAELQAGRVDLVIPPSVPIAMLKTIDANKSLKIVSVPGLTVYALRFNTRDGVTANPDVRRAISMAVDRDAIIASILQGQAVPIASLQSSMSFGYDPALKSLPYDPKQSMALLKKAGVAAGTKIQIDIRNSDSSFIEVNQVIASYLKQVGLDATIKPYESNYFLNDIVPNGKTGALFQESWGGWTLDFDNTAYSMYHSGQNWNPYDKDAKLDALLESQRALSDGAKREVILQSIGRYVQDNALELPLYNLKTIYAINERVKGFIAPPDVRLRLDSVSVQ